MACSDVTNRMRWAPQQADARQATATGRDVEHTFSWSSPAEATIGAQGEAGRIRPGQLEAHTRSWSKLKDTVRWRKVAPTVTLAEDSSDSEAAGTKSTASTGYLEPGDLLGNWKDTAGNKISVYSMDAFDVRLMATLSRPPRADINLFLRPIEGEGGWRCGGGTLDAEGSASSQLFWTFPGGRKSVWLRAEACGGRQIEMRHQEDDSFEELMPHKTQLVQPATCAWEDITADSVFDLQNSPSWGQFFLSHPRERTTGGVKTLSSAMSCRKCIT